MLVNSSVQRAAGVIKKLSPPSCAVLIGPKTSLCLQSNNAISSTTFILESDTPMSNTENVAVATELKSIPVPLLDLKAQYAAIRDELRAAIDRVAESQHFILGPEVEALEKDVAEY